MGWLVAKRESYSGDALSGFGAVRSNGRETHECHKLCALYACRRDCLRQVTLVKSARYHLSTEKLKFERLIGIVTLCAHYLPGGVGIQHCTEFRSSPSVRFVKNPCSDWRFVPRMWTFVAPCSTLTFVDGHFKESQLQVRYRSP